MHKLDNASTQSWQKTLWICFAAQLCTAVGFSTIFPFLPLYLRHLSTTSHLSTATLSGLVYSVQAFTMMIASPFWGALADKYGRKPMVVRAMVGGGIIILLMGFVKTVEQLIFLRAVQGIFTGVISAVSALVVSKVPRNKTGYAMGILQLGLWSGMSLGPLLGGLLSDYFGFRFSFIATAFLLCTSGIIVWINIEESYTPVRSSGKGLKSFARNWHRILLYPGIIATFVIRLLCSMGRTGLAPILPLFVQSIGSVSHHAAGYTGLVLGLSSAASTVSALYLGKLGDKIGHQRIAFYSAIVTALFFLPQSLVTKPWQLMILYTITGAGIGGLTPSLSALLARLSKPADAGSVYGIDNSLTAAGRAISPLIAALVAAWLGLRSVFIVTGLFFAVVVIIIALFLPKREQGSGVPETSEIIERELAETE